jgi:transposase
MAKKYQVTLTEAERTYLKQLLGKGKLSARKLKRAQILLAADAGQIDDAIAANVQVHVNTVERVRKRFVEGGVEPALTEAKRPGGKSKLGGKAEAVLIALACSDPPIGQRRWTMRLLAGRLVEMGVVETISDETVRLHLKKTT